MLKSIKIQNFKAIKDLTLNNLVGVNYLVGPNGCGKSSVLEAILIKSNSHYKLRYQKMFEKLFSLQGFRLNKIKLFPEISTHTPFLIYKHKYSLQDQINIIQDNYNPDNLNLIRDLKMGNIEDLTKILLKERKYKFSDPFENEYRSFLKILKTKLPVLYDFLQMNDLETKTNKTDDSSGMAELRTTLVTIILLNIIDPKTNIILIDEPFLSLEAGYLKLVPELLSICNQEFKIQIVISTHSPFIISAAASLPDQKVYMIKAGTCVNSEGESGYTIKKQVNQLLGIGFDDYHNKVVICEGEPIKDYQGFDAEIYNTIFVDKEYLFVSAGGETALGSNSILAKKVIENIFKASKAISFYLKDGDEKSVKIRKDESDKHIRSFGSLIKFTNRYSLECYLFDPEVIKLKYPKVTDYQLIFDQWKKECWKSGKFDHADKLRLHLDKQANRKVLNLELAKLINPTDTPKVYQELYNCIFGEL